MFEFGVELTTAVQRVLPLCPYGFACEQRRAADPIRSDPIVAVCVCALTCVDVLVEAVAEDHDSLQTQTPIGPQNVVVQSLEKRTERDEEKGEDEGHTLDAD